MSHDTTPPRIPGVRYRKVTRFREETTTINGVAETRQVPYSTYEPMPPRDWDAWILRAVTGAALSVTALSVSGTTASIGALLNRVVPEAIGYGVASVFDVAWLACLGLEWLERYDPKRARPAKIAGWFALGIAMAAVVSYGTTLDQPVAGAAGASVSLLAKGLWAFVLRYYAVPLSDGVAHWLRSRREKITANLALGAQIRRLDARDAYAKAIYGPAATTKAAITTAPEPDKVPAPGQDTSGHGQEPGLSGHADKEPSGHDADTANGGPDTPVLRPVGGEPRIAATVRKALADNPHISDDDLVKKARDVHGDGAQLAETVRRTRRRIENRKVS